jgi:hypothetical protein
MERFDLFLIWDYIPKLYQIDFLSRTVFLTNGGPGNGYRINDYQTNPGTFNSWPGSDARRLWRRG